jgi:hypothetical protein
MLRCFASAVLALLFLPVPLHAELKYTLHLEMKKVDGPPPSNPMLAMMGDALGQQLLPDGPADIVYTLGEKGVRAEFQKTALGQPAGTVTLSMPDGTLIVMNPKEQTYWKTSLDLAAAAIQAAGLKPEATAKQTGESAVVAGVSCERVLVDIKIDLPIPEAMRASLPPGFPTTLTMNGENCLVTERFKEYAALVTKTRAGDFIAAMGLDKMALNGIVLRQVLRLSNVEMEGVVTSLVEEPVPASLFTVPPEYKEVPAPLPIK